MNINVFLDFERSARLLTFFQKFRLPPNFPNLGSFELSYVSPENDKIEKMGWWKLGRKSGVWRRKTGFENFLLDENESVLMRTLIWRGQKNDILAKKCRKWPKRFSKFFG